MGFGAGLSGVAAANKDLKITGNNIANASTTGFKASRAEFGDAYTTSILGMGQDPIGSGVNVTNVGQKFEQGNISQTNSVLDLAVDGNGFFVTEYPNNAVSYTRSGIFGVDKDGYVVSNQGATLQGFGVNQNGIVSGILQDLRVDAGNQPPRGTHGIEAQVNVPAGANVLQSIGSTTRTNGLAVGVAQVGPAQETVTTLNPIGIPTLAGTASQELGAPIGFSGATPDNGITFPWQPTARESAFTLDFTIQGPNINGGFSPITANIQPFSDSLVYENVNDLVAALNAAINGNPDLAGLVQAVPNDVGGLNFETAGTYGTDGTNIISIIDNVGGELSTREYLNFSATNRLLTGNAAPGLNIVNAPTGSLLTSSIDVSAVDSTVPSFLDAASAPVDPAQRNEFAVNLNVENQPALTLNVAIPTTAAPFADAQDGWASITDFINALNIEVDAEAALAGLAAGEPGQFAYDAVNDRIEFRAAGAALGPNRITITTITSQNTAPISFDDLGFTSNSLLAPSLAIGQVRNDTLSITAGLPAPAGLVTDEVGIPLNSYGSVDELADAINGVITDTGTPNLLANIVRAYNNEGVLSFIRIDSDQTTDPTFTVDVLDGPLGVESTLAEQYLGLDNPIATVYPDSITADPGLSLFESNGFIDLTSDPGQAVTVQGNSISTLTFEDFTPGTNTVLSSSVAAPTGAFNPGGTGPMSFTINIGGVSDFVTVPVPGGGWADFSDFLTDLEDEINDAPLIDAAFPNGAVSVGTNTNGRITITSADAGIGPVEIRIVDQTNPGFGLSDNPTTLGLSTVSIPAPVRVFGEPDQPANNVLELSIDGGVPQILAIPAGDYSTHNELLTMINDLINSNPTLASEVRATQVNGRLVFERTEIGAFPLDVAVNGTTEALEAFGLTSSTKTLGEEPVDRTHSFRVNLSVPLPDEEGRSGSVEVSLDEVIYSIDQLAASINRELASVPEDEYVGVRAVVVRNADDNEVLQFVATEAGEASQISITNILAPGEDLEVEALYGLLQADRYNTELLEIGEPAITNGYPEQSLVLYDSENDVRNEITIEEGTQASEIASQLSAYPGMTATAETDVRILLEDYVNGGDMELFVNGQVISANDFQGIVDEINSYSGTSLNSLSASLDSDSGDILINSSIGIDISVAIETPNELDGLTVQGASGTPPVTLGRGVDAETNARMGGYVDIVLNGGYELIEPDPRVAGLFNGLTESNFTDYVINAFDPNDPDTYNESASLTTYDSLGNQHRLQLFYVKDPEDPARPQALNSWTVYAQIDGENVGDPDASLPFPENIEPTFANFKLYFNADGTLDEENTGEFLISNWDPVDENGDPNGAYTSMNVAEGGSLPIQDPNTNSNFAIGFGGTTQYGGPFARYNFQQDGYASGRLKDLEIADDGIIYARYTNGEAQVLGQVALASFANMEGLTPIGQTEWQESFESGDATIGEPGTGLLGTLQSAALEDSTVDLSEQLVHLIIAQRNYQASAKTIETANAVTQTIINLR